MNSSIIAEEVRCLSRCLNPPVLMVLSLMAKLYLPVARTAYACFNWSIAVICIGQSAREFLSREPCALTDWLVLVMCY